MKKTVVINIVGLSAPLIGEHTPFLKAYTARKNLQLIDPVFPALTTSAQSTYLTGKLPDEHGIVGNGWYDREDAEVKFWKQSNKLVQAEKIWDKARREDAAFTCANMFWWYNMYSTADYSVTPRPNYLADGRKMPDCYSQPANLRDMLQEKLGTFPLFQFWGPGAGIASSRWIADASVLTDKKYNPTLTLIYLPHLDYCLQKAGPDSNLIAGDLREIDAEIEKLITWYEGRDAEIILLSEYGIAPVSRPVHLNRVLRAEGYLSVRTERGLELLDPGASRAFAVADHQLAHIYIRDSADLAAINLLLKSTQGVELVLDKKEQQTYGIQHLRTGDLVVVADADSWFTYYFWHDDALAPDYARTVDIFKKPGYDPVEMFISSKLRAGYKLLKKKAGFRYVMDVIPLDATLIKGSHGRTAVDNKYKPVLISSQKLQELPLKATAVFDLIWAALIR